MNGWMDGHLLISELQLGHSLHSNPGPPSLQNKLFFVKCVSPVSQYHETHLNSPVMNEAEESNPGTH